MMKLDVKIDLICYSGNSGLTDYSVSLARAMSNRAKVTLVTSNSLDQRFRAMAFSTLPIFRRARHYPFGLFALIRRYGRIQPRTLIFQSWLFIPFIDGLVARLFSLLGNRMFVTVHDTLPHHPLPWSELELSYFYKSFHGLIAHSEKSVADLRALGVTKPIMIVPHGIYDLFKTKEVTKEAAREKLDLPANGELIMLQFGHIDRRKGCFEFLEVARRCKDLQRVHFVLAGRNDLSHYDRRLLDNLRLLSNVTVHDRRIDFDCVQLYFRSTDIVVQPYLEGTTSGVYRLALAFAVPVVATEVGDLQGLIARGAAISIGSGAQIVNNLEALVRRLAFGSVGELNSVKQCLELEAEHSSWDKVTESYFQLLNSQ